jgi:selenocysteine lyase/cysteine desulfurase
VASWVDRFAPFEGVAWLDAAARGPMPIAASRAARDALAFLERPQRLLAGYEASHAAEARAFAARLFTAPEEAASIVRSGAAALALFAEALDLGPGDEVVVPYGDDPGRAEVWSVATRRGARLVEVPPEGPVRAVSTARLVAFSHGSPFHGGRIDPPPVVARAREVGARVAVDGSVAAGALPFDLGACGVDLYVAGAERHLLGPPGAAIALFSPAALALLGGRTGDVVRGAAGALPGLEAPGLPALLAFTESLRLLVEAGPAVVYAGARALCDRVLRELPPGYHALSPLDPASRSHVVAFAAWDPRATAEAWRRLVAARVQTTLLDDRIRVAPHLYTSDADVDRLLAVLASD